MGNNHLLLYQNVKWNWNINILPLYPYSSIHIFFFHSIMKELSAVHAGNNSLSGGKIGK